MGEFSLLDHIFNVCRSFSDILHIFCYVVFLAIAIIIAIHRYDKAICQKHIYYPIIGFLVDVTIIKLEKVGIRHRGQPTTYRIIWNVSSNRLPYIAKAIRAYFKKR